MEINCKDCNNSCCGINPHLTPVLLPSEEEKFKPYSKTVKTPYRKMLILAKKKNKKCIFLNEKTMRCTNHRERPLECRLYPFLLNFQKEKPNAKLDKRFCPNLKTLKVNKKEILDIVSKQDFPKDWIDAYKTLEDY